MIRRKTKWYNWKSYILLTLTSMKTKTQCLAKVFTPLGILSIVLPYNLEFLGDPIIWNLKKDPPKPIICRATFCSNYNCKMNLAHLATRNILHGKTISFRWGGFLLCIAIFKSYHRFSIKLRSGLWLGHSRTFNCFSLNHLSLALAVC